MYVIMNEQGLWWSNTNGWCDNTRSLFTKDERDTFNLPMGGKWIEKPFKSWDKFTLDNGGL